MIKLRLKEIREQTGKEADREDGLEVRQIKVDLKHQLVCEIPMPTNDPKLVEEVIKLFIEHIIESKRSKTKVSGLHTLVGKPMVPNDYEELNRSLQNGTHKDQKDQAKNHQEVQTKR